MEGRIFSAQTGYRYGFNGKENDNEIKGEGNQQDYGLRIYDTRLGRFLSVDPEMKTYPFYSSYQFSGNMPIWAIDLDGAEPIGYSNKSTGRSSDWLVVSTEDKIKASSLSGKIFKYDIIDSKGLPYTIFREDIEAINVFNRTYVQHHFYYLDNDINNPSRSANFGTQTQDGSIKVKGSVIPFEPQEKTDAINGAKISNGISMTVFATAVAISAAPAAAYSAPTVGEYAMTASRYVSSFAKWSLNTAPLKYKFLQGGVDITYQLATKPIEEYNIASTAGNIFLNPIAGGISSTFIDLSYTSANQNEIIKPLNAANSLKALFNIGGNYAGGKIGGILGIALRGKGKGTIGKTLGYLSGNLGTTFITDQLSKPLESAGR